MFLESCTREHTTPGAEVIPFVHAAAASTLEEVVRLVASYKNSCRSTSADSVTSFKAKPCRRHVPVTRSCVQHGMHAAHLVCSQDRWGHRKRRGICTAESLSRRYRSLSLRQQSSETLQEGHCRLSSSHTGTHTQLLQQSLVKYLRCHVRGGHAPWGDLGPAKHVVVHEANRQLRLKRKAPVEPTRGRCQNCIVGNGGMKLVGL